MVPIDEVAQLCRLHNRRWKNIWKTVQRRQWQNITASSKALPRLRGTPGSEESPKRARGLLQNCAYRCPKRLHSRGPGKCIDRGSTRRTNPGRENRSNGMSGRSIRLLQFRICFQSQPQNHCVHEDASDRQALTCRGAACHFLHRAWLLLKELGDRLYQTSLLLRIPLGNGRISRNDACSQGVI